jgi:hypothetical protein
MKKGSIIVVNKIPTVMIHCRLGFEDSDARLFYTNSKFRKKEMLVQFKRRQRNTLGSGFMMQTIC